MFIFCLWYVHPYVSFELFGKLNGIYFLLHVLFYSVTILMSTCSVVQSVVVPEGKFSICVKSMLSVLTLNWNPTGVLHMECHERYFMIAVDLSFTGEELRFEVVGKFETNGQWLYCIQWLFVMVFFFF